MFFILFFALFHLSSDCDGVVYGPTWNPLPKTGKFDYKMTLMGLHKAMKYYKLVPEIVPEYPKELLWVTFHTDYCLINVTPGEFLQTESILKPPTVKWDCNPKKYYMLLFTDPDDPLVNGQNTALWMLGNIHDCNMEDAEVIYPYWLTNLKYFIGPHRYTFTLYDQKRKIHHFEEKFYQKSRDGRSHFDLQAYERRYRLDVPQAGNFFMVEECALGQDEPPEYGDPNKLGPYIEDQ